MCSVTAAKSKDDIANKELKLEDEMRPESERTDSETGSRCHGPTWPHMVVQQKTTYHPLFYFGCYIIHIIVFFFAVTCSILMKVL